MIFRRKGKIRDSVPRPPPDEVNEELLNRFREGKIERSKIGRIIHEIAEGDFREYTKDVAKYLYDEDDNIRSNAIMTLGLFFKDPTYKKAYLDALYNSEDMSQMSAISALMAIGREYNDVTSIKDLIKIARDESKDDDIRIGAYEAILNIYGIHPRDTIFFGIYPTIPEKDIDWQFLEYVEKQNYNNIDVTRARLPNEEELKARPGNPKTNDTNEDKSLTDLLDSLKI